VTDDAFDSSPPFLGTPDTHPLPPTFYHSGRGFATNFEAFTEYKLEVTLIRPPESYKFYAKPIEQSYDMKYMPTRNGVQPNHQIKLHQQYLTVQSLRLLPEKADAKLTMKEKMRSAFSKSELPTVRFHVMVTFPTQIWPGGDFSLKVCVRYGPQSEDISEKPPIYLESANIEIKTYTVVRAPGVFGDHHDSDSKRQTIMARQGLHIALPGIEQSEKGNESTDQWYSLSRTIPDGDPASPSWPLDFDTYNISTCNKIDVKLDITCADKQFSVSTSATLRVLPPISGYSGTQPTTAVVAGPSRVGAAARVELSDAGPIDSLPPPPYVSAPTYDSLESEIPQKGEGIGTVA
jgi:hypothetical protein